MTHCRIRTVCVVVALFFAVFSAQQALALPQPAESVSSTWISREDFVRKAMGLLFERSGGEVVALDRYGNDVTSDFLRRYKESYEAEDWEELDRAFSNELYSISRSILLPGVRSVLRPTAVREEYLDVMSNDGTHPLGIYTLTSIEYQYNDSTNKIVGTQSPKFSAVYYQFESNMTTTTSGVSTWKSISADGTRLSFGVSFTANMEYSIGGFTTWSGEAGPFSLSYVEEV